MIKNCFANILRNRFFILYQQVPTFNYQNNDINERNYFDEKSYTNTHQPEARNYQNNNINGIVIWSLYSKLITNLSQFGYTKTELRNELDKCNTVQDVIDLVYSFVDNISDLIKRRN